MTPLESYPTHSSTFLAWIFVFATDVNGSPGSTHTFRRFGLSYKIHFLSPVILCKKYFFLHRESKFMQMSTLRFLLSSVSSCGTHLPSFCIFPIACNRSDIAWCVTPNCWASSSCVWHGFSFSNTWSSSSSNFSLHLDVDHSQDENFRH